MRIFRPKPKCPTCETVLHKKPSRKQKCPHCGNLIFIREGQMVTEEEALTSDWIIRLEKFGLSRKDFNRTQEQLSEKFGKQPDVKDTVWGILNNLILKFAEDNRSLESVYREMASLVSKEGKDPTPYLLEAENAREKWVGDQAKEKKWIFLGHDELAYIRRLRKKGKIDQADELLMKAEPSPAVLDEIRKNASIRARNAKKEENWQAVIQYLEGYNSYSDNYREYCINMVNQEPPMHTETDRKLLQEARGKLTS